MASENMKRIFPDIGYCNSALDALCGADACLIMTEWSEFKSLDTEFNVMKNKLIIDGRHMQSPRKDIDYVGLCW
jgi:UDPglucose 6-dehydrogenase